MTGYAAAARLVDRRRLQGMVLALRRDAGAFDRPDAAPDPTLVDPVAEPFTSVAGAHDGLDRLEARLRERGDRRAVFLSIYVPMTRAVWDAIDGGRFENPAWMREYTVTFANYYRRAFLAFERGAVGAVPDPWRIAFGTAVRGDALVVQSAFLGINAHINYDLALTLDDVDIDPDRRSKRRDHRAIDGILARLVDAQQAALAEVYAPGVEDVDESLGRLDESLSLLSLTEGREQAWRVAVVLADAGWPPVRTYARWVLRATATGGAFFVLAPNADASLLSALRRVERDRADLDAVLSRVRARVDEAAP